MSEDLYDMETGDMLDDELAEEATDGMNDTVITAEQVLQRPGLLKKAGKSVCSRHGNFVAVLLLLK